MDRETRVLRTVLDVAPMRRRIEFGDGFIWIPGLDNDTFELADKIRDALATNELPCRGRHRASHGIQIGVPDSSEVSPHKLMDVMWDIVEEEEATRGEYP